VFIRLLFESLEVRRHFTIPGTVLGSYHSHEELTRDLQKYADAYPAITQLISIGKSVQNRPIWALKISDNPKTQEDEPELRYIGMMHGDEPVGMENTLRFATMLLEGYGDDSRLTQLVDTTEIWIVPNMNPDGLELGLRNNVNDVDLNRNFPEGSVTRIGNIWAGPAMDTSAVEPETAAMMKWSAANSFTLSANFHSGSLLVNYPYDSNANQTPDYAASPDDALFREIALTYAERNATMTRESIFPQGITNGDNWYEIYGGIQDWSYRYLGGNDVTVELSYVKKPDESDLESLWHDNRDSMLNYAESIHWGVRGVITRTTDNRPVFAKVTAAGNSHGIYTDPDVGDYHRMLLPGIYSFTFAAPGYHTRKVTGVVVTKSTGDSALTKRLDIRLKPLDEDAPLIAKADLDYNQPAPAVRFVFDEDISASLDPPDFRLVNTDHSSAVTIKPTIRFDDETNQANFAFPRGTLPDGNYRAVLGSAGIADRWGNTMAQDKAVKFFILQADANRDRRVDDQDVEPLVAHFGSPNVFSNGDFDYSGMVDSMDLGVFLAQRGKSVPAPALAGTMSFRASNSIFSEFPTRSLAENDLANPWQDGLSLTV